MDFQTNEFDPRDDFGWGQLTLASYLYRDRTPGSEDDQIWSTMLEDKIVGSFIGWYKLVDRVLLTVREYMAKEPGFEMLEGPLAAWGQTIPRYQCWHLAATVINNITDCLYAEQPAAVLESLLRRQLSNEPGPYRDFVASLFREAADDPLNLAALMAVKGIIRDMPAAVLNGDARRNYEGEDRVPVHYSFQLTFRGPYRRLATAAFRDISSSISDVDFKSDFRAGDGQTTISFGPLVDKNILEVRPIIRKVYDAALDADLGPEPLIEITTGVSMHKPFAELAIGPARQLVNDLAASL